MESRLSKPFAIAAVVVALLIGFLAGGLADFGKKLFGGPNAQSVVESSLESMHAQNRLVPFVARFVSVSSSKQEKFGLSAERTLILPGTVRYELDLARMERGDLDWNAGTKTLSVKLPDIEIAGPEADLKAAREYGSGGILSAVTDADAPGARSGARCRRTQLCNAVAGRGDRRCQGRRPVRRRTGRRRP
jgi:hypothetical protein